MLSLITIISPWAGDDSVSLFCCAKRLWDDEYRAFDLGKYLLDLVVLFEERQAVCIGFGRPGTECRTLFQAGLVKIFRRLEDKSDYLAQCQGCSWGVDESISSVRGALLGRWLVGEPGFMIFCFFSVEIMTPRLRSMGRRLFCWKTGFGGRGA